MAAAPDTLLDQEWTFLDRFVTFLFRENLEEPGDVQPERGQPDEPLRRRPDHAGGEEGEHHGRAFEASDGDITDEAVSEPCALPSGSASRPSGGREQLRPLTPKFTTAYARSESGLSEASTVLDSSSPYPVKPRVYFRSETDLSEAQTVLDPNWLLYDLPALEDDEEDGRSRVRAMSATAALFGLGQF